MKVSRAQAEQNREHIIDVASELFRKHGLDGVSLSEIMAAAGLTNGGFYGNFESKDDLAAKACARGFDTTAQQLRGSIQAAKGDPFAGFVDFYLSDSHRADVQTGCVLVALASDASRHGSALKSVFTDGIRARLEGLAKVAPGRSPARKRRRAVGAMAQAVGAMLLARAVKDPELAAEILAGACADLTEPRLADERHDAGANLKARKRK